MRLRAGERAVRKKIAKKETDGEKEIKEKSKKREYSESHQYSQPSTFRVKENVKARKKLKAKDGLILKSYDDGEVDKGEKKYRKMKKVRKSERGSFTNHRLIPCCSSLCCRMGSFFTRLR